MRFTAGVFSSISLDRNPVGTSIGIFEFPAMRLIFLWGYTNYPVVDCYIVIQVICNILCVLWGLVVNNN